MRHNAPPPPFYRPYTNNHRGRMGWGSGFLFSSHHIEGLSTTEKALKWEGYRIHTSHVLPPTPALWGLDTMTSPFDTPLGTGLWVPLTGPGKSLRH